ncbi:hypothetical protein L6452_29873 [Arctium lappa]|uniref:Uncharacterized protein n=1 Tax=Arctium lappa TaxID=4217 RepID=A0ACB8ZHI6_ARCLA|nr:hypothetical protein L6452_29873 [Arctium lappa]
MEDVSPSFYLLLTTYRLMVCKTRKNKRKLIGVCTPDFLTGKLAYGEDGVFCGMYLGFLVNLAMIPDHLLPKVSIVGRPNVGKSTLFNRLVGGNRAIVVGEPGVTRDRLYGRSFWGDHEFMVIDTGGFLTVSKSQTDVMEQQLSVSTTIGMEGIPLASREAVVARTPSMIERQATVAVEESSVIIFVVDGQIKPKMYQGSSDSPKRRVSCRINRTQ